MGEEADVQAPSAATTPSRSEWSVVFFAAMAVLICLSGLDS